MKLQRSLILSLGGVLVVACVGRLLLSAESPPTPEERAKFEKLQKDGNFKDAYDGFRKLALSKDDDPLKVGDDLAAGILCLPMLARVDEVDGFRQQVIDLHQANWRLLWAAAETYLYGEHYGFLIAGKFYRGNRHGGGPFVYTVARDRIEALQLMQRAMPLLKTESDAPAKADFYLSFAKMLLTDGNDDTTYRWHGRYWRGIWEPGAVNYGNAWRLQVLTNLKELPEYEPGWNYGGQTRGAPVDADDRPIFYSTPKRWEDAANDGQRWRWALAQAVEMSAAKKNAAKLELANFLHSQFGVQTMAQYGFFGGGAAVDGKPEKTGPFAVQTLSEEETMARLASGVKRFKLPDEFNFIKIYEDIAERPQTGFGVTALEALAQIFENRRQYPKAADYWRRNIKEYGPGANNYKQDRLDQIVGNWGRFEPTVTQPARQGATLEYTFRNGHRVSFEAREINIEKLLGDVKAYLKTRPQNLNWQQANISNLGYRLVTENQQQYLGPKIASWSLDLKPPPDHFSSQLTVATPLQKAGAYLIAAKMADGNTSSIVAWLADTAIVRKPLNGRQLYLTADAVTGNPIGKMNLEFFGYRQRWDGKGKYDFDTANFAEFTDADGQAMLDAKRLSPEFNWVTIARNGEGRLAYMGFSNVWYPNYYDAEYNQTKVFTITDRPVYRPGQTVKFKFWIRHAKYDEPNASDFGNREFDVEIRDPKNNKSLGKRFQSDAYGGIEAEFELPSDATLGVYQLYVLNLGGGSFRVEEYKKPEFEVSIDAPSEPIMLGEKIKATIKARYYFGSPVSKAKVKYKVLRTAYNATWYPVAPWDWFYGPGYWWFAYDEPWYPGWRDWGCKRPIGWWIGQGYQPPEVVADAETAIGPDGTLVVDIDTAAAKAVHPDEDHEYQITAEVVDPSRRTIVGAGSVLVARKPFQVTAWVDRGYYRAGDQVEASFAARTLDGKPVAGRGHLILYRVSYDKKNQPVEHAVEEWNLDTNAEGQARQALKAAAAGQYRLSYRLTDAKQHTIEGGYLFTVTGQAAAAENFRFNDLELIPDRREYAPGDKVKLLVNVNRTDATVWLFIRPANGVYLPPKTLRLEGKSTTVDIGVTAKDMPNFFVEALTIVGGRTFNELKEIVVPPESRVLNVAVEPSRTEYRPGQKSTVAVKLTDPAGKPFVGTTVLAIYDKAVEYISGGSNVPEIKAFFWKWRRTHYPQLETNLTWSCGNLVRTGEKWMNDLGAFGMLPASRERYRSVDLGDYAERAGEDAQAAAAPAAMDELAKSDVHLKDAAVALGLESRQQLKKAEAGPAPPLVQPNVRSNFADTALWVGSLATNEQGEAEVSLSMPENLTTWKVKVWGLGQGTKVGQGEAEVITRKDLIVRLQAPRFFIEKDEVVLSANVQNDLKTKKQVQVALELGDHQLVPLGDAVQQVEVPAGGQTRVDWRVKVAREGQAVIRMKALTDEESDAVEQKFPVYVHGQLKMDSFSGALRPAETTGTITFNVPAQRREGDSRFELRYSPTLAGAMVDALPYLADYPYGCTEQTLNRFLPTVITQRILLNMGLDLKQIAGKQTNLNAQEIGDDRARAGGWKRFKHNPVFDNGEVARMVKEGVERLGEMQLGDGGWGWFSGWGEQSYPHTTAVVVHGLQVARVNDVAIVPGVLERGVRWLKHYQEQQVQLLENALAKPEPKQPYKTQADDLDAFVAMVLTDAGVKNARMIEFLYRDRTHLAVYSKALFGLALEKLGDQEKLAMILKNISQYVVEDKEDQTAYLKLPEDNYWWNWYGSDVEADSYYLKLLCRTEVAPKGKGKTRGHVAPELVKYLLNNRKHASYWNSTRDTSLAIEALAEYLKASGEDKPDETVEVWLDGKKQKEVHITAADLFAFDNKFVLRGDGVTTGKHQLELRKKGTGPLYYNAYLTTFSLEDMIPRAGLEVKVNRKVYKLIRDDKQIAVAGSRGQAVNQRVEHYKREELADLATLKSGDLVEVELEIDSKNDYEYLLFEDHKAAGFEAADLQSGYNGNDLGAYMELRDDRVSFFVRALSRGKHSVAYRLRAEIPGRFSALPATAAAMYAPELRGNSDEIKLQIAD